jgi:hypothetical protein
MDSSDICQYILRFPSLLASFSQMAQSRLLAPNVLSEPGLNREAKAVVCSLNAASLLVSLIHFLLAYALHYQISRPPANSFPFDSTVFMTLVTLLRDQLVNRLVLLKLELTDALEKNSCEGNVVIEDSAILESNIKIPDDKEKDLEAVTMTLAKIDLDEKSKEPFATTDASRRDLLAKDKEGLEFLQSLLLAFQSLSSLSNNPHTAHLLTTMQRTLDVQSFCSKIWQVYKNILRSILTPIADVASIAIKSKTKLRLQEHAERLKRLLKGLQSNCEGQVGSKVD